MSNLTAVVAPTADTKPKPVLEEYKGGNDIELGAYTAAKASTKSPYNLIWNKVCKNGDGGSYKALDNNIGYLRSGEMIGLIGLTKSGKTPLMKILCGQDREYDGEVLLNGVKINDLNKRQCLAHIPQFNLFNNDLTVLEHLNYTLAFRGAGRDLPMYIEEMSGKVTKALELFGLITWKDTKIFFVPQLERRRLSVLSEFILRKHFFFLDASYTALEAGDVGLYSILKYICKTSILAPTKETEHIHPNISVMGVINQPVTHTLNNMDRIMLLNDGKIIYYGVPSMIMDDLYHMGYALPRYTTTYGVSEACHYNPGNFLVDLMVSWIPQEADEVKQKEPFYEKTKYNARFVGKLPKDIIATLSNEMNLPAILAAHNAIKKENLANTPNTESEDTFITPFTTEVWLLCCKFAKTHNSVFSTHKKSEVLFIALVAGLMWWQTKISEGTLFKTFGYAALVSIYWYYFTVFNSCLDFIMLEKYVASREINAGAYSWSSYFTASLITNTAFRFLYILGFVMISYMIGFDSAEWTGGNSSIILDITGIVLAMSFAAESTGLLVASVFTDYNIATSLLGIFSMCQIIFGKSSIALYACVVSMV